MCKEYSEKIAPCWLASFPDVNFKCPELDLMSKGRTEYLFFLLLLETQHLSALLLQMGSGRCWLNPSLQLRARTWLWAVTSPSTLPQGLRDVELELLTLYLTIPQTILLSRRQTKHLLHSYRTENSLVGFVSFLKGKKKAFLTPGTWHLPWSIGVLCISQPFLCYGSWMLLFSTWVLIPFWILLRSWLQ